MKRKSLRRISITTTPEAEDAVAELLSGIFGASTSIYSDTETGISTVSVYLRQKLSSSSEAREKISAGLKQIESCGLKIGSGKVVMARMRHEDWANSWKRHFKPIEIGALLVKPSWSKRKPGNGQIGIILDPGLSFGTGHHPTTSFCLNKIVAAVNNRRTRRCRSTATTKSFLDLGTGSGILAIAAAKLGYSPVHALDFDPEAVRVANANARANRVREKMKIQRGNVTKLPFRPRQQRQRYDLVCANLISNLLIAERGRIAAQLKPSGTLVLAGILKPEFPKVQRAYEAIGLKLVSGRSEKEWRSGSLCFKH